MLSSENLGNDPNPSQPSLEPLLGALLRQAWQRLRARLLDALHEAGFTDLNAAHINVFQYPPPERVRPIDLARRASMTRQAMNYLLAQLEQAGYLTRGGSGEGGSSLVSLTQKGRRVVTVLRTEVKRVEHDWAVSLGRERFDAIVAALKQITR